MVSDPRSNEEFCNLIKILFNNDLIRGEFIKNLSDVCSSLRVVCRAFSAAQTLFDNGDVSIGELPDDLQAIIKGASISYPPLGSREWTTRVFLGVRVLRAGDDAVVARSGGIGGWVCSNILRYVEDLVRKDIPKCFEGVRSRAEALVILSDLIKGRGGEDLGSALARVSESVLNLLPGVSRYATLAWLLRFAPIPSLREGLRDCGFRGLGVLFKQLLMEFSPVIFDLSECRVYKSPEEVPNRLLMRSDYLVTSGFVVVRREVREGRDYVIYGEEVPSSPIYGFLNTLTEGWVRAEELLFGTSPALRLLEDFIEDNLRETELRLSSRAKGVIEVILNGKEFKVTTIPGKDEFSEDDRALVLELTPVVTYGIMNASVGWDGVKRGNAVVNRYAIRFKPSYVLTTSKRIRSQVKTILTR